MNRTGPVRAAGGVLWLPDGPWQIGLVHRPKYDDWSLPKGKLYPGEHPLEAAVREIREETGQAGLVGRRLRSVGYRIPAGPKTVEYWAVQADGGRFTADAEVDGLEWLPVEAALDRLSYDRDAEVLRDFSQVTVDALVLLVRHAAAGDRGSWPGPDELRPLDPDGIQQAERLAEVLPLFGPVRVVSANQARCVQTVQPLARRIGADIEIEPALSEQAHAADPALGVRTIRDLAAPGQTVVACGQGGAIPDTVAAMATDGGLPLPEVTSDKASVWALSFRDRRLVAADYYPDFEPWTG